MSRAAGQPLATMAEAAGYPPRPEDNREVSSKTRCTLDLRNAPQHVAKLD